MSNLKDATTNKAAYQDQQGPENNLTDTGVQAAPDVGEAYFIWAPTNKELNYTGAKHHVATVIAKDTGDRVTSEADCGDDRTAPHFVMYGTAQDDQTFLHKNAWYFSSKEEWLNNNIDARLALLTIQQPHSPALGVSDSGASGNGDLVIDMSGVPDNEPDNGGSSGLSLGGIFGWLLGK